MKQRILGPLLIGIFVLPSLMLASGWMLVYIFMLAGLSYVTGYVDALADGPPPEGWR